MKMHRKTQRLAATTLALAIACALPGHAFAKNYDVQTTQDLIDAINDANSPGADPAATITLLNDIALTSSTLPSPTIPLTIDTQGFTLTGGPGTQSGILFAGTTGTLDIKGTLDGGIGANAGGVGLSTSGGTSSVVNDGQIRGGQGSSTGNVGGAGISQGAGTFVNNGMISGGLGTGSSAGGVGAQVRLGGTLTNYGTVEGGAAQAGTGGNGIVTASTGATVVNYGTIKGGESLGAGTGGIGISVGGGGTFIIQNAGMIEGGAGAAAISSASSTYSVTNSGTIRAGAGQANAIFLNSGISRGLTLELQAGSTIVGNVVAQAGSTVNVFRLGGTGVDSFDVSSIGNAAQYQNFTTFQKTGTGTWSLTGDGTTATAWDIQLGTLQVGNGGTSGSFIGNVSFNVDTSDPTSTGTLAFDRSDAFQFDNLISGNGSVTQVGTGITTLTGNNTYTGGTVIGAGTLRIQSDSNLGDASGALVFQGGTLNTIADIVSARTVALHGTGTILTAPATTYTLDGAVSGTGGLTKTGDGTLVLGSDATYAGTTTIGAGTLQLGHGSSGANFASTVVNNAAFVLDRTNDYLLSGDISGTGSLTQIGSGTAVLTGENSYTGGTTISAGTLQVGNAGTTGSLPGDVTNNGALAFDRSDTLDVDGIISGSGEVVQAGTGTTVFNGAQTYTGATTINAGRLAVNGSVTSNVMVNGGGTLGGTGTIEGNVINAGIVGPGNSIGTLTVAGNYIGQGGTVEIEAALAGDASASDRLVVTGDTSGSSHMKVVNVGGAGAQTVEGIKVIDVQGASTGNFDLVGDYVYQGQQAVVAGPYAYRLYKGGTSTPNDGDWYLRSVDTMPAGGETPPGGGTTPPAGGTGTAPPAPLFAPNTPVYEAYAGVLQQLNTLGTLQQRVGSRDWTVTDGDRYGAAWVRVDGGHTDLSPNTTTTGTHYDASTQKAQVGVDFVTHDASSGVLVAGATLQYGRVDSNVSSSYGLGKIKTKGYGIGGTLTWYGEDGFYADAQAQWNRYDSDLSSRTLGHELVDGNDATGYNAGVEAGLKLKLSDAWSLIPQMQLTYSTVRFDRFDDPYGAVVRRKDSDSLVSRGGMAVDYSSSWRAENGSMTRAHLYGIANVYYDFRDGTKTDVSGAYLTSKDASLWGGVGAGGSLDWKDGRYKIYGEAMAQTSLHDGDSRSYGVKLGFDMKW